MVPERLQPILDEVSPFGDRFRDAGRQLYLVGGIVRDLLLGRELRDPDIDLTTDARPEETLRILKGHVDAVWDQGARFGTIGAKVGDRTFEITTHRAEAYTPETRKPTVQFSTDVEADLSRRDFTVNAMALALPEPELIDPFGGAADLAAGVLRTPTGPHASFSDDPLRMMRAARFVAGYGLTPEDGLVEAVVEMRERLDIVSPERIRDELDKLLVVEDPSAGLWFLVDTGLIDRFLPELPAMRLEQDPIHRHKDVLAHSIAVTAKTRPERIVRLAALLHDIGKPRTRVIGPNGVSFHHHEVVGARMARKRMKELRYSNDDIEAVSTLVDLHLRFHTYKMGWSDSAVRRFVRDAGPYLSELIELTRCDCTTRNRRKAETLARRMDELEVRIEELREQEELAALRPDLDGRQVMELLDLSPGPDVGRAMEFLMELRLEEGPVGEEEAARRLVAWWESRT
ncbi:CCA tRNA nucleotidyltransferase [Actinomarinicola tropica]|uniref:CCA tRNA nucleotidyltransferase n=1 Tax=Actinomarinicola tropica TaxID=2789776 RepID=A0A5Q2RNA2_9ACTN|nr:CCA tRNA nucleotidyltransferase [Actinomarinicola tropica]QGG96884.1 CCA tRNA nucleotidyltransferase [Actinomarinicola tropica]